jgi:hypothetical protein
MTWSITSRIYIQSIESIQRQFTRRIPGLKNTNYWQRLKELK